MTTNIQITSDDTIRGAVEKLIQKITDDVLESIQTHIKQSIEQQTGMKKRRIIQLNAIPINPDNTVYTFYKDNHDEPQIFRKIGKNMYGLRVLKQDCGYYFDPTDFRCGDMYGIGNEQFRCVLVANDKIKLSQI